MAREDSPSSREPAALLGRPAAMPTNRRALVLVSSFLIALASIVMACSGEPITIPGAVGARC